MIRDNPWLVAAGCFSLAASLLHVACIFGGPDWYRYFGAGERMARAAAAGQWGPAVVTAGIAAVLVVAAAYAFSGAGLIGRLPLLRLGLVVVSVVYLARGLVFLRPSIMGRSDLSSAFLLWSSLIVLVIGLAYALGTWRAWSKL